MCAQLSPRRVYWYSGHMYITEGSIKVRLRHLTPCCSCCTASSPMWYQAFIIELPSIRLITRWASEKHSAVGRFASLKPTEHSSSLYGGWRGRNHERNATLLRFMEWENTQQAEASLDDPIIEAMDKQDRPRLNRRCSPWVATADSSITCS